jgi:alanine-glyoxylate transaminase/serine-glyoxylate transaminase/serine-pyruvate transaminase
MNDSGTLPLWPAEAGILTPEDYTALWERLRPAFLDRMRAHRIEDSAAEGLASVYLPLAAWVRQQKDDAPLVLGVNGAQGSGKSTLCDFLRLVLSEAYGYRVAGFSIDDLYKTRAERERLAQEVHPLLITRGVPGTHDVDLGLATIRALKSATPHALTPLPVFDKARDDRRPSLEWLQFRGRPDIVIFEGWCVGTAPQSDEALARPVNELEQNEDADGAWRRYVNAQLQGEYAELFGELDRLILLKVPGMESVFEWRGLQEQKLAETTAPNGEHRLMDAAALRRFIMHYERLTRHTLEEMPDRADLTLYLDENHRFTRLRINRPSRSQPPAINDQPPVSQAEKESSAESPRQSATSRQTPSTAIRSFHPPVRTLMGPGPSDVHPRILEAMARPTVGHLDPSFIGMMDEMKTLLHYAFRTGNELTLPVSAPGSAGMETCFVNLVEPGDKVIVCQNGVFGGRMQENVERCGGIPILVQDEWGLPVDPNKVADALAAHPDAKIVAFVHAETSTGACSDVETLTRLAHEHGTLVIVDAVTSLGGSPLEVDAWEVDAIYSGSQKCLSCTPGLSPVSFGPRAVEKIRNRATPCQSWFLDLSLVMNYWGSGAKRAYHHTAPVNALYGLHEALVLLQEEGLENAWKRHRDLHEALKAGLEALRLRFIVPEAARLPQLNTVAIPAGVDDAAVRSTLLSRYGLEIGAGLGVLAGKVWRIGLMGHGASPKNVIFCLSALEAVLAETKAPIQRGVAVNAAQRVLVEKGY